MKTKVYIFSNVANLEPTSKNIVDGCLKETSFRDILYTKKQNNLTHKSHCIGEGLCKLYSLLTYLALQKLELIDTRMYRPFFFKEKQTQLVKLTSMQKNCSKK